MPMQNMFNPQSNAAANVNPMAALASLGNMGKNVDSLSFSAFYELQHVDLGLGLGFSERELMFMFAICRRPSVCLSSVVCNVRAPYSGD